MGRVAPCARPQIATAATLVRGELVAGEHPVSILGTRVLRTEDPRFLTTGGVYTEDVVDDRLAGAYHLFFVRSPIAHAKITAIDASAALEAPGVVAVFTGADLAALPPRKGMTNPEMAQTALATGTVRFVGEAVAAVLTREPYQGEDAIELVSVDYDPLPAVIGFEAALAGDTVLFESVGSNVAGTFGDRDKLQADLFDGCEAVVSQTIVNQRVAPAPMESRAAAAVWGEDGRLTAWIPNQGAQGTKGALARQLGVDPAQIRVITPDVGGAFGAKFGADPEHVVIGLGGSRAGPSGPVDRDQVREPGRDDARPGPGADRDHRRPAGRDRAGLPAGDPPGRRRLPAARRDPAVADHPDGAGPVRHPQGRGHRHHRGHQHHAARAPTAAPGGPRRRRRWSGPWTCSRPRSGWTRRRSGGRTCCRRSPSRTRPPSARCTTAATTWPGWTWCWRRPATTSCAASRPSAGPAVTWSSSASAWPPTWRSPVAATSPGRRTRTPPSRCTRTAAPPS